MDASLYMFVHLLYVVQNNLICGRRKIDLNTVIKKWKTSALMFAKYTLTILQTTVKPV